MVLVGRRSTNTYVAASFGCLLREDAKHKGEQFTPYSVRHRYAKGMLVAYVSIANISEAMGQTIERPEVLCAVQEMPERTLQQRRIIWGSGTLRNGLNCNRELCIVSEDCQSIQRAN